VWEEIRRRSGAASEEGPACQPAPADW
jgi:hypothetical protein